MLADHGRFSLLRATVTVAAVGDLALGLILIAGNPLRTSGPSFATAKSLMPLPVWGALLVAFGVVLAAVVLGHRTMPIPLLRYLRVTGASLACGWHAFFASAFENTARMDPRAARTGVAAYGTLAALHLVLAWHRGED